MRTAFLYLCIVCVSFLVPIGYGFFQKKQGLGFLDRNHCCILKGVAILCVVVCHFMGKFGNKITWFTPLGGIGVSIFLLLSGYGLTLSWKNGGCIGYWRKRIITVFIPYIIFEIVTYWLFTDFDLLDFVLDITCVKPIYGNGWYLQYLLGWYIVFWIVMKVPFLQKHKYSILLLVSAFIFFLSYGLAAEQALSFVSGVVFAEYKDNELLKKHLNFKTSVGLLLIGVLALAFKQIDFVRNSPELCVKAVQLLIKLPIGIFIVYAIYQIGQKVSLNGLAYIGTLSYEMYLVHGFVLEKVDVSMIGVMTFVVLSTIGTMVYGILNQKYIGTQLKRIMYLQH